MFAVPASAETQGGRVTVMHTSVVRTSKARASAAGAPVIRRTVTGVGCAAAVLVTVAACGTVQNLTAGQKVDNAVERLGEQKSLAFGLRLDADPDDLTALAGEESEEVPPEMAEFFTGLRVDVSVKSRKALADSGEKDIVGVGMKVSGDDGALIEYRVVGDYTYYRADMEAMGEAMGVPFPTADELDELPENEQDVLRPSRKASGSKSPPPNWKTPAGTPARPIPANSTRRPRRRSSTPYAASSPASSPSRPRRARTAPRSSPPRPTSATSSRASSTSSSP